VQRDPATAIEALLQRRADQDGPSQVTRVAHARALRALVAAAAAPEPLEGLRRAVSTAGAALPGSDVAVYAVEEEVRLVAGAWAFRAAGPPRDPAAGRAAAARAVASGDPVHVAGATAQGRSLVAAGARWRGRSVGAVVACGPALSADALRVLLALGDAAAVLLGRARDDAALEAERRRVAALEEALRAAAGPGEGIPASPDR
jgi:hypothetical protein